VATRRISKSQSKRPGKSRSTGLAEVRAVDEPAAGVAGGEAMPSAEQIRQRAYEIFLARGGVDGNDWSDWFIAERQLLGNSAVSKA